MISVCSQSGRDRAVARRQRIVDSARGLFIENGFHATGVAQIAKASEVAVGQIYRDFEAKEDIVARIVEADLDHFISRGSLHEAIAAADSAGVWAWIRNFVYPAELRDTEQLFAEIIAESARNERISGIFERACLSVNGSMLAALELIIPGDALRERRALLADFILAQSVGLRQLRLLRPSVVTEQLTANILRVIDREICELQASAEAASAPEVSHLATCL